MRGLIAAAVLLALVAGLPWALWHYVGWPLPHSVPTWAQVEGVLLGPMTTTFLVSFLACVLWIVWALFTLDVLRCTIDLVRDLARGGFDAARLPDFSAAGPVHALAGVLVGAVLLSVLGNRLAPAPTSPSSAALGSGAQIVSTAPAWQHPAAPSEVVVRNAVFATPNATSTAEDTSTVGSPARAVSVVVLAPQDGVYDSLWRIAQRTLGDGARWPEIFEANKGRPQPNGKPFTRPSLIFPGQELALPADATAPTLPAPPPQDPPTPTPTTPAPPAPPPTTSAPTTTVAPSAPVTTPAEPAIGQQPTATGADSRPTVTREPGVAWGVELFVGLGLAAAVSAALLVARRRYRARYRPGSGDRDDLPVAPVVYGLHLAHLRADDDADDDYRDSYWDNGDGDDGDAVADPVPPRRVPPPPAVVIGARTARPDHSGQRRRPSVAGLAPGLGVRGGREIALDLAAARGLGLVGAGALSAARAVLLAALTTTPGGPARSAGSGGAVVVVPAEDLSVVLGHRATQVPASVRVVADLDTALDALEAETLVRAAHRDQDPEQGWPPLVLVARPPLQHQRLQAVLDNGAPFAVTGLLLGQWQPGVTCYVRDDGTISATGPGLGEALRGTRMFRLGGGDTSDLLALLRDAEPPADDTDGAPGDGGGDNAVVSPMTRPRSGRVPGEPARLATRGADRGGNAAAVESSTDRELEITAAAQTAPRADAELEILGPSSTPAPGARLRPRPASPRSAPPDPPPSPGQADDGPAPRGEHTPTMPETETAPTASASASVSDSASDGVVHGLADGRRALITITVLGGLRVHWHPETDPNAGRQDTEAGREITGELQPRSQVLLVLLALHLDGATRETLVEALWGQHPPARPTNSLHTALSRLRRDLARATGGAAAEVAAVDNGRYRLDPAHVEVDYWRFATVVAARRAATTDAERVAAYRDIIDGYGGRVADGLSKIDWLEPVREATRREAIDAVSALARAMVQDDPQQTLDLLEIARAFDPHNELLYRDIMRLQERLGQLDAIPRTLTLLTTRLAEVNDAPTPKSQWLAANLGQQHDTEHADRTTHADRTGSPVRPAARGGRGRSA